MHLTVRERKLEDDMRGREGARNATLGEIGKIDYDCTNRNV